MKRTLLDLTQSILSNLSSDEVNSISDTTESLQVAEIIKQTYFNIISRDPLPKHLQMFQLDASLTTDQPVIMYIPDGIGRIEWLKYYNSASSTDTDDGNGVMHDINVDITNTPTDPSMSPLGYEYVTILPFKQFVDMVDSFTPSDSNVESFTFTGDINGFPGSYTFQYKNNATPSYCTILSNYYVIFDTYDATQDDTLQSSKTKAYGEVIPAWSNTDSFIPNLNDEQFALLINEAKSLAYFELKQMTHQKADIEARRGWTSLQKSKQLIAEPTNFDALPNFGRRASSFGWPRWSR